MYSKIKDILNGLNLLIVEDDESLRESIKISVENYVSEVYACANAKEALEVFETKDVNLVLSDINMPHMNGLEMAARIRGLDKDVPIIFLTAYGSDENMLSAIELGSFGVLKKPFEKRDLIMQMSFAANKFKNDFAQVDLKNGFKFNAFSRQLTKDGRPVALTKKEQNLLHLFLKNQGRVVSFEMIESCVWQDGSCTADAIRSFVYKLRKKLYPELIQNAQGSGYALILDRQGGRTVSKICYV